MKNFKKKIHKYKYQFFNNVIFDFFLYFKFKKLKPKN